jgi:hypothetical protein
VSWVRLHGYRSGTFQVAIAALPAVCAYMWSAMMMMMMMMMMMIMITIIN